MLDRDLLTELQYVLIEPPNGGDSWPSEIWTRAEVLDAVNGGVRALARDTHLAVHWVETPTPALTPIINLPLDWLATGYLVWRAADGTRTPLGPVDSFEGDLAVPGWEAAPGLPLGYADLDADTLTLRLVPTPAADGTLELLYIQRPAEVDGTNQLLPLPPECDSGIKYAALGTLLRKVGRLLDPERADYCDRRYELTTTVTAIILAGWS